MSEIKEILSDRIKQLDLSITEAQDNDDVVKSTLLRACRSEVRYLFGKAVAADLRATKAVEPAVDAAEEWLKENPDPADKSQPYAGTQTELLYARDVILGLLGDT